MDKFLIPRNAEHFVDVYGGSVGVILRIPKFSIMTYNDMNGEVVNFFRVLRDKQEELQALLIKEEFDNCAFVYNPYIVGKSGGDLSDVERAGYFFVCAKRKKLLDAVLELKLVQIENKPALDVIQRYDNDGTVLFVDPLYVSKVNGVYEYEMADRDHRELAEVLNSVNSKVVLSGYKCDLYKELYANWTRIDDTTASSIWINFTPESNEHGFDF